MGFRRYTGSYLDRSNGWRAVATWLISAKLHSSDASLRCQLGPCQGGLGASRTSALEGKPDIASEPRYVADVPLTDIAALRADGSKSRARKVFSGTIPLGGEGNNEGMKALFVHPGPLHESVSAA
jgi:hypothetical protein